SFYLPNLPLGWSVVEGVQPLWFASGPPVDDLVDLGRVQLAAGFLHPASTSSASTGGQRLTGEVGMFPGVPGAHGEQGSTGAIDSPVGTLAPGLSTQYWIDLFSRVQNR